MHTLSGPEDAARTVDYWAAEGVTSFKAYMDISPEELKSAIDHAHARGLKITGHLCSVGFREAAALWASTIWSTGIVVDTEFFPGKKPVSARRKGWRKTLPKTWISKALPSNR